ncbi:hypothetical protein HanIR_Chr17g0859471 [Helianthus annuus]|nr:hypothetical protein HanIR_Chr17g0859471 [Helianthus annuus]
MSHHFSLSSFQKSQINFLSFFSSLFFSFTLKYFFFPHIYFSLNFTFYKKQINIQKTHFQKMTKRGGVGI